MKMKSICSAGLMALAGATALMGCGANERWSGQNALAPGIAREQGLIVPNEARVEIPFDPGNFAEAKGNPFFPLIPGTTWSYVAETPDGVETNTVEVTRHTKVILGVATTVVHDRVFLEGSLTEDTFDWYAQDKDGNVWYFGEDTKEIEDGQVVTTAGSWEAGKNGAEAGIIMLAHPKVGDTYFQENAPGVVEDQGRVLSLNETVSVPYGTFEGCLKTAEWTPLEPGNRSFKYYASGIGLVLEVAPSGGGERVELTGLTRPRGKNP